jgi:hypothetical protein
VAAIGTGISGFTSVSFQQGEAGGDSLRLYLAHFAALAQP